ncbi:peroxisomal membrane protein PMP22 isoform X1 [Cucurbita maxima]|uniref:Peroxisomal membrane protein PMP22 isoform X1 n=1 Tax=Cucurbita maxima TaxID=3661 RepID=A0A6J1KS76_CUCMA|nr:peroxisomal membrane protein PMP22 isoform X1 [Cucurbita maxima]XP_023003049.1 peroxisomal membrane protein PMP22 isoform X1 [Cucurbita maxima]
MSLAKKAFEKYVSQLYQHPLRTKVITSGVLVAINDVTSQKLIGIQKLQLRRILLKVLYGCLYLGPFGHFLHQILDKIFQGKRDSKTVAKKVLVEQLTSSPLSHFVFLVYYGLIIERRPWVVVKAKVKKEFPSVQLTAWMFWPFVGWINHQYIPLQLRVIFHSLVAFVWGIFLNLRAKSLTVNKS